MGTAAHNEVIRPRVAIHALFDPDSVGGVQANALSLIGALAKRTSTSDISVLALPQHAQKMRELAKPLPVVSWSFGQLPMHPTPASLPNLLKKSVSGFLARLKDGAWNASQALRKQRIELIHFPFQQYFETNLPSIYEPWDLQHRHLPEFFSAEEIAWRDRLYKSGCKQARLVVTASRWTKDDIAKQYAVAPEKIVVIERGSALFEEMLDGGRAGSKPEALRLDRDFILFPAFTYRHKNHIRLLQALKSLRDRNLRIPLVCTGRTEGAAWADIQAAINELGLIDQVQFLGPVSDENLIWLYRSARALVFPSLFEGLGLPVLEAMAAGLPVICGASTCVSDIVADNGILFDPYDVSAMATSLEMAWFDIDGLRHAVAAGRERLSRYSWANAAPRFEACYRQVAGMRDELR